MVVGLTPVGWALGTLLVFLAGEGDARGTSRLAIGVLGSLVFVVAPATAVALAVPAVSGADGSGRAAMVVSVALLGATLALATLVGTVALIATIVAIVALGVGVGRLRAGPTPPR